MLHLFWQFEISSPPLQLVWNHLHIETGHYQPNDSNNTNNTVKSCIIKFPALINTSTKETLEPGKLEKISNLVRK